MSDPNHLLMKNLKLTPFCQIPQENLEGFIALLDWLFSHKILPVPDLLSEFWIIPEGQIDLYIETIIETVAEDDQRYQPGEYSPDGVAIPIEEDGEAKALILVVESLLDRLSPDNFFHIEALSTIMEEILHTYLYSFDWKNCGYIRPTTDRFGCKTDLFTFCTQLHDEYAVTRWKSGLLASFFSAQNEDGNLVPVHLAYGSPLDTMLTGAVSALKTTIIGALQKTVSIDESWTTFCQRVYRSVLEPLARNAAYCAANPNIDHPYNNADMSRFFTQHVRPFWLRFEAQLERSFETQFIEKEQAIRAMVDVLESLLDKLGARISEKEHGNCWVDFTSRFFDENAL